LKAVFREWVNQQIGLDRCIAALQQIESTWNEINSRPLSDPWQRSDLEMLIPSWNTLYAPQLYLLTSLTWKCLGQEEHWIKDRCAQR
jgi:hypothetical protein